jgi:hypothetical protein
MMTPENTEEEPDESEPGDEGDNKMECFSHYLYSPNIGAAT